MASVAAPLRSRDRIQLLDVLRGVALLGILLMNIPGFSNPIVMASNLNLRNEYAGPNYYTWWVVEGLFEGTMRALFSLLFGAGCLLLLDRLKRNGKVDPAHIYYSRTIWLFLFGLFNAYILLWPGDILYAYALCGLFLYPFRNLQALHLLLFSLCLLLAMNVKGTYELWKVQQVRIRGEQALALERKGQRLTEQQQAAKAAWTGRLERRKPEALQKEAAAQTKEMQQGYFGVMAYFSGINAKIESYKMYHQYFLDNLILIFLGMALFRWNVLTGKRSMRFYLGLLLAAYGLGLPLSYYEHRTLMDLRFDSTRYLDHFYINFYEQRRILLALGHMSVVILLYKAGVFRTLWKGLSRVGQMAFTNYLMQSILCSLLFYGYGFGLFGTLERYETYYVVAAVWVFQFLFSNLWLRFYRFGPFEWLWRSLTYWKRQPFRRAKQGEEAEAEAVPAAALA
ncbi:MAG TPA: DUF418 domain-containing protein [Chitinophagaceae bacterium]|jgi:uncharacterized protein|nr:DUF418 domain-containing protein [Chitinophagaceae bacterium]